MKKKLIILGGTGFIGINLLIYFSKQKKYKVYGTYNIKPKIYIKNVSWIKSNLLIEKDVSRALKNKDFVIQAAATTSGSKDIVNQPYLHVTDNAIMNSLILRSVMENKIDKFIFFSCTVMYDSKKSKIKETDLDLNKEINPKYYGVAWTKLYTEKMCRFYSNICNTKFTIIRHSNIYGPFDKFDLEKSHVFGATITKVMKSNGEINIWGDGNESRDLLYIDDLIDIVKKSIDNQKINFQIYNCGYGKAIQIKSLVKKIIKSSGKKIKIKFDLSKPTIKTNVYLDTFLAKKELNWYPKTSIELGIKKTIRWWKKNIK